MHSFVPALLWAAILVSVVMPPSAAFRRDFLNKLGRQSSVTELPIPPPVSPVLPRVLEADGEGSTSYRRLKTEKAIQLSLLAPVDECDDVMVSLDYGETALLYSRSDEFIYTCKQSFKGVDPQANLTLSCQHFRLKFNCAFEELTVVVDGEVLTYCMDDQVSLHQGRTIELTYERRVMGFNGGYVCTVSCLGSPPAPPPESAGCPTCGVTVDMEAKGGGVRADHRIVGGQSTVKGAYPWAAHLKISEQPSMEYRCGGSLVTNKLVVTAAHCLSGDNIQHIDVTLGMVDTRIVIASDMVRMRSSDFVIHPEYDEMTLYNDIAVIHLPEAVTFTDNIRPLCLPSSEESMEGKVATAIGWGTLQFYGKEALVLQEVDLDVWSNADCMNVWSRDKYGMLIGSSQVCALRDGKDTCSGDSGGPLMVQENGKYQLHGITSFGQGCATPGIPGVYTRASSYVTWIESFISEDYCQNGLEGYKRK